MSATHPPRSFSGSAVDPGAILRQPFRVFFAVAALYAAVALPLWVLVLRGTPMIPAVPLPLWHGHELLFGFTTAVIAGFLLTASENWTGLRPLRGWSLLALLALWLGARIGMLLPGTLPLALVATLDIAFLLGLLAAVARVVLLARNHRNLGFIGVLLAFAALDAWFFGAAARGDVPGASHALFSTTDLIATLIVLVGGRVIPFFTQRRLPHLPVRRDRLGEWTALPATALAFVVGLIAPAHIGGVLFVIAGVATLVRMRSWQSLGTLGEPLLAVLHVGYLWVALGLILRGLGLLGLFPVFAALHALTAGAIGTLTLGMMTRVTRGHTGRELRAGRVMTAAFALMVLAGMGRVAAGIPALASMSLLAGSGLAWAAAFAIYLVIHLPALAGPRKH